jgi:hypothetical protein
MPLRLPLCGSACANASLGCRAVVTSLILLLLVVLPVRAQLAATQWERLPDGRVLIDIHGHRVAFAPDLPPGEVGFARVPGQGVVDLRRVIDDPAWARERFQALPVVWIFLVNAHNVPGRFLGRFDRRSVPNTSIFRIGLYADRLATACEEHVGSFRRACDRFAQLAQSPPALDEDGFVVDRPDFLPGLGSTFYIVPAAERVAATGEPIFFRHHDVLGYGRNGISHLRDGYFAKPGVRLLYQFSADHHPKVEWRQVDARFRAVLDDILVSDSSTRRR